MSWKRLSFVLVPLIVLIFLYLLQVYTQLENIRKLPAPGWSRTLEPSTPLTTSVNPYIQETDSIFNIYTAKKSTVTHTQLNASLKKLNQKSYALKGTIEGLVWGNDHTFIYEKDHSLFLYDKKKPILITKKWTHVTTMGQMVIYSNSHQLYDYNPSLRRSSEIAGFAYPIVSIHSSEKSQSLIVTTYQNTTNHYSFFLLKDNGEQGFQPSRLGFIQPATGLTLDTVQMTTTSKNDLIVIAFKDKQGKMNLESVRLPLQNVQSGEIGQPKAHPLVIRDGKEEITQLQDLHLNQVDGSPSLLFVSGPGSENKATIYVAHPTDHGIWMAEKRSASFTQKAHPVWLDSSHQVIAWRTPKSDSLQSLQFTSHDAKLAEKSLRVRTVDVIHALKKTQQNIGKMGRFLFLLLLFAIPAASVYAILIKWTHELPYSNQLTFAALLIFLFSEIDWMWHVTRAAQNLPNYLSFPLSAVVYGIGLLLISWLVTLWVAPKAWLKHTRLIYSLTLFMLWATFLIGPYF